MDAPLLDPLILAVVLAVAALTIVLCLGALVAAMQRVEDVERLRVDVVRLQRLYSEQTNPVAARTKRRGGRGTGAATEAATEHAATGGPDDIAVPRIAA